jgi:hypothetical protein
MPFLWDTRPRQWKHGHLKLMTLCCLKTSGRPTAYPMARYHYKSYRLISDLPLSHLVGTNSKNVFLVTEVPTFFYPTFSPRRLRLDSTSVYVLFLP